jgi:hypothetical protein
MTCQNPSKILPVKGQTKPIKNLQSHVNKNILGEIKENDGGDKFKYDIFDIL